MQVEWFDLLTWRKVYIEETRTLPMIECIVEIIYRKNQIRTEYLDQTQATRAGGPDISGSESNGTENTVQENDNGEADMYRPSGSSNNIRMPSNQDGARKNTVPNTVEDK